MSCTRPLFPALHHGWSVQSAGPRLRWRARARVGAAGATARAHRPPTPPSGVAHSEAARDSVQARRAACARAERDAVCRGRQGERCAGRREARRWRHAAWHGMAWRCSSIFEASQNQSARTVEPHDQEGPGKRRSEYPLGDSGEHQSLFASREKIIGLEMNAPKFF